MPEDLWTRESLHKHYGLSIDLLGDLLRSGELVGFKIGVKWYVRDEDWQDFLERRRQRAIDAQVS